jgi:hypothetical protein
LCGEISETSIEEEMCITFLLHTTEPDIHSLIVSSSLSSYQVEISHKYTYEEDIEPKYSEVYCLYTFNYSMLSH